MTFAGLSEGDSDGFEVDPPGVSAEGADMGHGVFNARLEAYLALASVSGVIARCADAGYICSELRELGKVSDSGGLDEAIRVVINHVVVSQGPAQVMAGPPVMDQKPDYAVVVAGQGRERQRWREQVA